MSAIPIRKMDFEFPDELPLVFIEGEPEESFLHVGMSLLLPYLEPYLIRTMRAARPRLHAPELVADLDSFVGQEGQHYRQHMLFNERWRRPGYEGLAELERELDADYRRFSEQESLAFNLAYAEGFEALTTAMALAFAQREKRGWHPAALDLFEWHLCEELEHRAVAFDVYEHVIGSFANRVRVGFFAQRHLLGFMKRVMLFMVRADTALFDAWGGEAAHRRRLRAQAQRFLRELLVPWLRTFSPLYTPHDIELSPEIRALAERYSQRAVSVR